SPNPEKKAREIDIKLTARLRKRVGSPEFRALSERLEELKHRHERGMVNSVEFLKALLDLARDVVMAEREIPPAVDEDLGKEALTELFQQVRTASTPIIVERIVNDIDAIVRTVRFPGWQKTAAGEREVKIAVRRTLLQYQLHRDGDLFDKTYGYVREYY
ncbi:MAG TPA: hypothetical protein VIB55_13965, partial [Longimicrobium sp.]